MENFDFRQCSPANKQKRQYKWTSSWDNARDFISREIQRGVPHQSIIAKLDEQGQPIKKHQFKRLFKQWGLSDHNLRQRHRKYIFGAERRVQQKGVSIRRWRFKDSGQSVKRSQLKSILESDGSEFKNIEASPGQLVASPSDVLDTSPGNLDTITNFEFQEEDRVSTEAGSLDLFPIGAAPDTFIEADSDEWGEELEFDENFHPTIIVPEKITLNFKYPEHKEPVLNSLHEAR
ncbi:hypothetical protein AA313_de0207463 [Arthrobotrys entomopaga]|nr:hypothetical protein AA313_de0207463 [Arthrobotrys entomopaga]